MRSVSVLALVASLFLTLTVPAAALFGFFEKEEDSAASQAESAAGSVPVAVELEITTYQDIPYTARFESSGGAGEPMTYTVDQEPVKGTVTVEGDQFVYTPTAGKTGTDAFTYTVTDKDGTVSQPAAVRVKIEKVRSGVRYEDTKDSPAAAAAQDLAELGVFTGTRIGGRYYFEPEREVSRSEFLAMAMETMGIPADTVTMTGFSDDAVLPVWAKSYAAAGLAEGVTQGVPTGDGVAFQGSRAIRGEEAAVILNRLLALEDVDLSVWYSDSGAVPTWAAQAVGNLETASVLEAGSFGEGVPDTVTRGEAAQMLSSAHALQTAREPGLLDWLK